MSVRKIKFWNVFFNKFLENALLEMPNIRLRLFTPAERTRLFTRRAQFIRNGTLEDKILYLAKAGYQVIVAFADRAKPERNLDYTRLLKILDHKGQGLDVDAGKAEMAAAGMFFLTDVDIVNSMNAMAATYQEGEMFQTLRAYSKVNHRMWKLSRAAYNDMTQEMSASHDLNRLILNVWSASKQPKQFQEKVGLTFPQFTILVQLSRLKISHRAEIKEFVGIGLIDNTLNPLIQMGAIQRTEILEGGKPLVRYFITGHGQALVHSAQKYLLQGIYD